MDYRILPGIKSPADLKSLSESDIKLLATEIRSEIIETVSRTGGHLASNLGVVELTLALHAELDCPRDKLIFDVGHQAYVHKLLTGRYGAFDTIRQQGGLSGFPRTGESEYDAFSTGHASTAISAGVGIARARDLLGQDYRVTVVVGDGAFTGGMCYEALNDMGSSPTHMTIVLNDNDMSIARNVGALHSHMTHMRNSHLYRLTKSRVRRRLEKMRFVGRCLIRLMEVVKDALKKIFVRGSIIEYFGLEYVGPVDGHDIKALREALRYADKAARPVLLHVVTQKGKGFAPAEHKPEEFHGTVPFFIETGERRQSGKLANSVIVSDALSELMRNDERIIGITAAMASGTGMDAIAKAYPKRVFDVGIAEEHAVTMAAGMAAGGLRPFVCVYSTFLQRAYDQIMYDVALDGLPVCLLVEHAGIVGSDGATHQGIFDIAYLNTIPGMTILAPHDDEELRRMIEYAAGCNEPVAVRYPRDASEHICGGAPIETGKWEKVRASTSDTRDITLLATGCMVNIAFAAAQKLQTLGISADVYNCRFIRPLDDAVLSELSGNVLTLEDGVVQGGFGEAVLSALNALGGACNVRNMGFDRRFYEQAPRSALLEAQGLYEEGIVRAAQDMVIR